MESADVFTPEQIENYNKLLATKATDTLDSYEFFYEGNGFKSWRKLVGVSEMAFFLFDFLSHFLGHWIIHLSFHWYCSMSTRSLF